jgi:hypothetical protein
MGMREQMLENDSMMSTVGDMGKLAIHAQHMRTRMDE